MRFLLRRLFAGLSVIASLALVGVSIGTTCFAQDDNLASLQDDSAEAKAVPADFGEESTVGIVGRYRLGHWTRVELPRTAEIATQLPWIIETTDGDGVDVQYVQPGATDDRVGYAIPSTEAASFEIRQDDQTISSQRFPEFGSPAKQASLVPIGMPWVVVMGDPMGVDQIGANDLLGRDATIAISKIDDASDLPTDSLGYSGVSMMMINASGVNVLKQMTKPQQDAVVRWIQIDGGTLFVCLGNASLDTLTAAPWLADVMPIGESPTIDDLDPSAFETYTSSQTQLETFAGLRLSREQGIPVVTGRSKRRVTARFVVRYLSGFGRVIAVAADLDRPPFVAWPERMTLLNRVNADTLRNTENIRQSGKRNTAFEDLVGQTRATLDQFPTKRSFQFSILSLVMMGLILLVGPIDYLLINRVLGRPLLGWLTLPLVVLAFSVFLVRHASPSVASTVGAGQGDGVKTRSVADVDVNHLEITDIDTIDGVGRGFAWNIFYSHEGGRFDVAATPAADWVDRQVRSVLTRPFGYASKAFGGIQIEAESGLPKYGVVLDSDRTSVRSQLFGIPLAPRSSKSIATSYQFDFPLDRPVEVLRRRGGDSLQTGLRNPLAVDVLDGMIVYRNWAYYLPTRFRSGQELDSLEELRQRNFRWHLTRQKATESSSDAQAWDAENFSDPMRLAEMLMFHDVVGGQRYTGLTHDALGGLDLTGALADDRCVMIGRLENSLTDVSVKRSALELGLSSHRRNADEVAHDDTASQSGSGRSSASRVSLVRVVLPVVAPPR